MGRICLFDNRIATAVAVSWFFLILLMASVSFAGDAQAKRVALVIGNSAYENVAALPNPVNDAKAMGQALSRLNFEVSYYENLDNSRMKDALRQFERDSGGADISLVYYAGHGMEMDKQNYLIPIDAKLENDKDVKFDAVPLDMVLETIEGNAKLKMILLDACRNNPFLSQMKRSTGAKRSIGRGLAVVERSGDGMVISYSAKEGTTASDGVGAHSPYTQALLDTIEKPGVEVNMIFRIVRDEVLQKTGMVQEPFFYQSLPKDPIYLIPPTAVPAAEIAVLDKTEPTTADRSSEALTAFDVIKGSTDSADFEALIARFPNTFAATLAQNQIARIKRADQTAQVEQERQQKEAAAKARLVQEQKAEAERQAKQQASANITTSGYVSSWVVIVGSYQQWEMNKAQEKRNELISAGYAAQIIDSNKFPRLADNLYVVVINTEGRNDAKSLATQIKPVFGDAYAKQAR